jgi:membrane protein implicated in regulation of membrane protease activity
MTTEHKRRLILLACGTAAMAGTAFPALAYVGPGAGLTLLGALWALILAIVMSVGFVLIWPFRRYLRRRRQASAAQNGGPAEDELAHASDSSMLANRTDRREER